MSRVYLDHNATTPVAPEVLDELLPYLRDEFGNASSTHWWGQRARAAVERARERVAELLGADPAEIVFTSGGTEAANQVLRGASEAAGGPGAAVVASAVEHHAVLAPCARLEELGTRVVRVPVDREGVVDVDALAGTLGERTALVAVMLANNEVGTIQPVDRVVEAARARGVPVFTDAVQAVGRIPVDVRALGVDFLSLSGHKLYGPKGVGALYVRRGTRVAPLLRGGEHEGGRRAGTSNVPGIVGLGRACELARARLDGDAARLRALRDRLEAGIRARLPDARVHGHPSLRLPNTLSVGFPGVEGESLLMNLDLLGFAVSTGSACNAGSLRPSHVLLAMGRTPEEAHAAVRFSLGRGNTEAEIDRAIGAVAEAVTKLRASIAS
ncbi:MAG: cysteine desulfurase [Deltaproteobacteria bacterium]|nr:cysteine desulfurase [Deltaproteobacteria bacterium]